MSTGQNIPPEGPETSSVFVIGLDDFDDPVVKLGVGHWRRLKGARRFPARDELVPRDMAPFLRNIALVRVIDEGRDYEYRIAGDAHVEAHGASFQGTYLSDLEARAPRYGRLTRATYEHVRVTGEPHCLRGWVGRDVPDSRFVYYESAFLTLGANEDAVDHLLILSAYVQRSAAIGR
jgi:hypothetical protein